MKKENNIFGFPHEYQKTKPYVNPVVLRSRQTTPKKQMIECRMSNDKTELYLMDGGQSYPKC